MLPARATSCNRSHAATSLLWWDVWPAPGFRQGSTCCSTAVRHRAMACAIRSRNSLSLSLSASITTNTSAAAGDRRVAGVGSGKDPAVVITPPSGPVVRKARRAPGEGHEPNVKPSMRDAVFSNECPDPARRVASAGDAASPRDSPAEDVGRAACWVVNAMFGMRPWHL